MYAFLCKTSQPPFLLTAQGVEVKCKVNNKLWHDNALMVKPLRFLWYGGLVVGHLSIWIIPVIKNRRVASWFSPACQGRQVTFSRFIRGKVQLAWQILKTCSRRDRILSASLRMAKLARIIFTVANSEHNIFIQSLGKPTSRIMMFAWRHNRIIALYIHRL